MNIPKSIIDSRFAECYDAVIIGSGMGGLTSGVEMALAGKKILVLEQHNLPGGFATTFVRGRYEFEATLHELLDFDTPERKGPIRQILDNAGIEYELERVPEAYVLVIPEENIDVVVPFGVDAFIDTMEKEVPGTREKMTRYMKVCGDMYYGQQYVSYCSVKGEKPDPLKIMQNFPNLLNYMHKTVEQVDKEFDLPHRAKCILYPYWFYQGVANDTFSFAIWAYMLFGYLTTGAYVPSKRSHTLACSMSQRIRNLGGQIEFNTKVEKIHVEEGKVVGVELADGTMIKTNHVLSNVHPEVVYGKMIAPKSEVPELPLKVINSRRNSCSCVTLYLGLDADPDDIGIKYYEYFIADSMDTEKIYDQFNTFGAPMMQSAICLDKAVPGASGPGRCQLSMTGFVFGDTWKDVTPENYNEVKDKFADALINSFINATGANLRDHIEEVEMVTPETWTRYTGAYKGQIFGYEQTPWDTVFARLAALPEEKKFDIKGLDFVGGCSPSAHAYSCTIKSGLLGSMRTLKEMEEDK